MDCRDWSWAYLQILLIEKDQARIVCVATKGVLRERKKRSGDGREVNTAGLLVHKAAVLWHNSHVLKCVGEM